MSNKRFNRAEMTKKQQSLPVYKYKQSIKHSVINNRITLIVGETGSGKTTQIPQYLLEWDQVSPQQRVVCTQPRTVAAMNVAQRVAFEQGERIGKKVGYHIRLDRKSSNDTVLEYMTEGVLLRKAMSCDNLAEYKVVIIDEAHERTVNADLLMGFLKQMVKQRADLRVIIMSATLDTERFAAYFKDPALAVDEENNPPILLIPGKMNPIQHHWLSKPTEDYKQDIVDLVQEIHKSGVERNAQGRLIPDGHILVFLTGQQEIDAVVGEFQGSLHKNQHGHVLEVYPLYSALSETDRQKAFDSPADPKRARKCVVATNIAETSLTIEDVVYVIDCGLSRQKVYSPSKGVEILDIRGISKASVMQRVGRAGRTKPGIAYHLYTREGYINLANETAPEIIRSGLVNEILSMLALGMQNPLQFDFIDPPDEMTLARALSILRYLDAIDSECRITQTGQNMARLPVNPRMAKSLVMSAKQEYKCVHEMIVIAAMLEIEDGLWLKPRDKRRLDAFKTARARFYHASGDHVTLLNVFNAYSNAARNAQRDAHYEKKRFCQDNFLNARKLDRADSIKRQIESVMASILREEKKSSHDRHDDEMVAFPMTKHDDAQFYENIIRALLCGHFMNMAVKGFKENFWRFRILDLDESGREKFVDVMDKAKCHQNSVFDKSTNSVLFDSNWVMYHEVSINQTTQLKILTAVKPKWLLQIDCNEYFNVDALAKDQTPISSILREIHKRKPAQLHGHHPHSHSHHHEAMPFDIRYNAYGNQQQHQAGNSNLNNYQASSAMPQFNEFGYNHNNNNF